MAAPIATSDNIAIRKRRPLVTDRSALVLVRRTANAAGIGVFSSLRYRC
jgi:hypothetical protein